MKLSQRLDIVVIVLVILYVLTGCTITTNPEDLGPCLQWGDIQVEERECTLPLAGGERLCVIKPYITSVCIDRESSN